jgi:phosphoribosyl-AMP cyclohydrolase
MEPDFDKMDGLIPAIVQDANTGRVLMLGYMNREAYLRTLESGNVTFFSRSRNKLWTKGETSGHFLVLKELRIDCDQDTLLAFVNAVGPGVCHQGYGSCFFRGMEEGVWVIKDLPAFDEAEVYGARA